METIDTIEYKGYTINIHPDTEPYNPREGEDLGTMICWHRNYSLGEDHTFSTPDDFMEWVKSHGKNGIIYLPLFLYDHSGISMSTRSFIGRAHHAEWDSGQVGWIYITRDKIKKEYGWKYLTKARRDKIIQYLKNEVETYDHYLTGYVYGYTIEDPEGNEIDASCWGYFGDPSGYMAEDAKMEVDADIRHRQEEEKKNRHSHWKRLRGYIINKVPLQYRERYTPIYIN